MIGGLMTAKEDKERKNREKEEKDKDANAKVRDGKKEDKKDSEMRIKELEERVMRLYAEMDNMKKRFERENERIKDNAGVEIVSSLLPVIDQFELAVLHGESEGDGKETGESDCREFKEGVKMIYANLMKTLKEQGLEEMDCMGKEFDPYLHDAVREEEVDDENAGKIVGVLQKGYFFKGNVIRHAKVVVGKKKREERKNDEKN